MNKIISKTPGLLIAFTTIDIFVILYWWSRCAQTQSAFYCEAFAFGGLLILLGIPVLVLFSLFALFLIISKWHNGGVSPITGWIIAILGVIVFASPYILFSLPSKQPKTYRGYLNQIEQSSKEKKNAQCKEYEQRVSEYDEVQQIPVPPIGCN